MRKNRNSVLLAAAGLSLVAFSAQAATLDGLTMSTEYLYPDSGNVYAFATPAGPFVVGAGVDGTINVEGVTDIFLDFSGNTLTVTLNTILNSPTWVNAAFNGVHILLEDAPGFTSFSLSSATMSPITTSFDADELFINWAGAAYVTGSTATFNIGYEPDPAPVPLPAGLPLLAAALGGLAMLRRRTA